MKSYFKLRNKSTIYLQVIDSRFVDRKFMYSTKKHVASRLWSKDKVRIGKNISPEERRRLSGINQYLKTLEVAVGEFETMKLNSSTLDKKEFKKYLDALRTDDRKIAEEIIQKEVDFFKIWKHTIKMTKNKEGLSVKPSTMQAKTQSMNKVSAFCVEKGLTPTLETIDLDFYNEFDFWMKENKIGDNTRGKHVKELKSFLRDCDESDNKYVVNKAYTKKKFKVIRVPSEDIYLNEGQVQGLLEIELSTALARHRDIFVAACYVGARHGDWHQINMKNVKTVNAREVIKIVQEKTGNTTYVPLHWLTKKLLLKHDGNFGKIISLQKFNIAVKLIAKKASIPEWERVKTHTARRAFATNSYLGGMRTLDIMNHTGHKSEASFLKYLKLSGVDLAVQASEHPFFQEANMKIA